MTGTLVEASAAASSRLAGVRVLFVLPTLGRGGAERQALLLARHLAQCEGAEVHLVSLAHSDVPMTLVADLDRAGLSWETFTLSSGSLQRFRQAHDLWRFVRLIRERRPQIVLPFTMYPNVFCALTWRFGGARACVWNQRDEGRGRVARWVERLAVSRVSLFVSNSAHGAKFLTDELDVDPGRVRIVHNGVQLAPVGRNRQSWRLSLGLPQTTFIATMVANLHRFKDHETLLSAWSEVRDRLSGSGRNICLLLAGAPGDRARAIHERIEREGLSDTVRLLGVVEDISGLLAASDIAVFSSRNEGLPNAVLEAMAAGLPLVATDYPGVREAVGEDLASWLVPPGDAPAMASRILTLFDDPELARSLGALGCTRIAAEFSVAKMAEESVAEIHRVLKPAPSTAS